MVSPVIPSLADTEMERILEAFSEKQDTGSQLIGLINVLSAGGLLSFGLFSLGIMPYVSSSTPNELIPIAQKTASAAAICWRMAA